MNRFLELASVLAHENVRYCLIGVWGANYHAQTGGTVFTTHDRDLFLPPEPANLVRAWEASERVGLELTTSGEPLDRPRDLWLAERIVERRALTRARDEEGIEVDWTLVMGEFDFESVWRNRRTFAAEGVPIVVARLSDIVASKAQAGRPKDLLFLETHKQALRELLERDGP
jgi:hypothetical protein